LALEIFVAVDAELGIVGKVGAELQEERPEFFVDAIEIVVVDHRGRFHEPWIGSTSVPKVPTSIFGQAVADRHHFPVRGRVVARRPHAEVPAELS